MRGATALALALAAGLLGLGCDGADPSSGLTAYLRATNAQYSYGELGDGDAFPLPRVDLIKSNNTRVVPGTQGRSVSGSVSGTASAVLVGLAGDTAHWIVPTGSPDLEMPGNFTFATTLSFSPDLPAGPRALRFRAISATGELGPAQALALKVDDPTPVGQLVIQLEWDTEADLDLHLRVPDTMNTKTPYFDVWAKGPRALPPQNPDYTPAELEAGGRLLFDSNAQCVIDGQRHEEIVFPTTTIPAGPFEVRVDTFSLCGEATARWHVRAFRNTGTAPFELVAEAYGQSTDRDTAFAHTGGSGVLAFTFTP